MPRTPDIPASTCADLAAIHTCESVLAGVAAIVAPQRQNGEGTCVRSQWTPPQPRGQAWTSKQLVPPRTARHDFVGRPPWCLAACGGGLGGLNLRSRLIARQRHRRCLHGTSVWTARASAAGTRTPSSACCWPCSLRTARWWSSQMCRLWLTHCDGILLLVSTAQVWRDAGTSCSGVWIT